MSLIQKIFSIIVFTTLTIAISIVSVFAEEKEANKPTSVTKQYRDWVYRCVNVNKKNQCEIFQTLTINETNIQFTFAFSNFINSENELKEVFTIITPLGINLQKNLNLKFHKDTAVNLLFSKCEVFGCVVSLTNNTSDKVKVSLFNQVKDALKKAIYFELTINSFQKKPLVIKSSLQGFKDAYEELDKSRD